LDNKEAQAALSLRPPSPISVFERSETLRTLFRAATGFGKLTEQLYHCQLQEQVALGYFRLITADAQKCIHTVPPPFSLTFLPFDEVAPAFM
jgi:hypothetical protein